jgi:hypothetical protein
MHDAEGNGRIVEHNPESIDSNSCNAAPTLVVQYLQLHTCTHHAHDKAFKLCSLCAESAAALRASS